MRRNKSSSKQSARKTEDGRPLAYDREIFIQICMRLIIGRDILAILSEPGMPHERVFFGWIQNHKEAREIHRSAQNFKSDRILAKELTVSFVVSASEWEE
jgi:hypothetical protein